MSTFSGAKGGSAKLATKADSEAVPRVLPREETFAAVERVTAASSAISQIHRLVTAGTLEPGGRLPSERELAILLGVSRPTLREAVRALEAIGVLEARAGQGTFVSSLSPELLANPLKFLLRVNHDGIVHLFEVRITLEIAAVRWAADNISAEELGDLDCILANMKRSLGDIEAFVDADTAFHHTIHQASLNPLLASILRSISEMDRDARVVMSQRRQARTNTVPQHALILEQLRARDQEGAGRAMHEHLTCCWADLFQAYDLEAEILARVQSVPVRGASAG